MRRAGRNYWIAAFVLGLALPATAQERSSSPSARGAGAAPGEKTWNLVLTIRPEQARKAAADLVQMVKDPSGTPPPILSNLLNVLSARISVEDSRARAGNAAPAESAGQRMATSACVAALNTLGQQAAVARNGYGALAAGLPADKVADFRQQVNSLANQLASATKSAIDQVRK